MKVIGKETWARRSQYMFFRNLAQPHFSVTSNVDVTPLISKIRLKELSAFNACLFSLMSAANAVPEMRLRFRGDTVVEHETVHASTTMPIEDDNFAFCGIEFAPDWSEFNRRCQKELARAKSQAELKEHIEDSDEWIFLSCLPWLRFTALSNPNNGPDDCIPRISWGKFFEQNSVWLMPVSVQVHHALVDGVHMGRFFQILESTIATTRF
jgi:chloramphenicol O-acetyltransferase type A